MEDRDLKKKRWNVTYTKHLRQKRKTYQDGFLDLHFITNKVMLLDDCEKLLECRILNHDEAVRAGETLSLNAFLVDVGDPEGDHHHHQSVTDPKVFESPRPGSMRRKKFRSPSICSGNGNGYVEKDNARISNLSPSRKVIREFKKSELERYGASKSYPDMEKSNVIEWQVMYTTHVTQKAKKYHDGFLKLATCGSHGRQVMLHDASRKLLTSRFLKKDETVRSNESVSFDGYLVEIGELMEHRKPLVELNIQQAHCSTIGKTRTVLEQHGYFKSNRSVGKEFEKTQVQCKVQESSADIAESNTSAWQVMYTTQVMQKTKKYHDGFLRLAKSGSLGSQIMLYDASKKLIDSRFLKKAETISSGDSIVFDAHLVDIGEPEGKDQLQGGFSIKGNITSDTDSCCTATGDGSRLSKIVPTNKPLRDANQILSILQKRAAPLITVTRQTDKSMSAPVSSGKAFQVLDADVDCTEENIIPKESSSNHGTSENMDSQASDKILDACTSVDLDSSNGFSTTTTSNANQSSNNAEAGNDQVKQDTAEAAVKGHREALAFIISSSASACATHGLCDDDEGRVLSIPSLKGKRMNCQLLIWDFEEN